MKNILTYVIIIAVAVFLLAPDNMQLPAFGETASMAGPMSVCIAFVAASTGGDEDEAIKCECGGDGDVGDGRIRIPCPCKQDGGECTCQKENGDIEEIMEPVPADWTYAVILTNPSWCAPCVQLDKNVLKKLNDNLTEAQKWKFSDKESGRFHIVTANEDSPIFAKYAPQMGKMASGETPMPYILIIRNGIVRKHLFGNTTPQTPMQFAREFNSVK